MDNVSIAVVLIVITLTASLISFVMASYRRQKGLWIIAGGFAASSAGVLMVLLQQSQIFWIQSLFGIILANLLIVGQYIGLACGIRLQNGDRPVWPGRYYLYLIPWLVSLVFFTFAVPSFQARVILFSVIGSLIVLEFHYSVRRTFPKIPPIIRLMSRIAVFSFVGFSLLRIFLVLQDHQAEALLSPTSITTVTFLFNAFSLIIWLGLVLILDGDRMMREMYQINSRLQEKANLDELTGLMNRYQMDDLIKEEMERANRYQTPLSAIMIDLDHFKEINDIYGHRIGDEVLKRTARLLADGLRKNDRLFRWGGEEFLLLVPHTGEQAAFMLSERLRQQIEAQILPLAGRVTASFGVAGRLPEEPQHQWFDRVDQAMLRAKRTGRNRVVAWNEAL